MWYYMNCYEHVSEIFLKIGSTPIFNAQILADLTKKRLYFNMKTYSVINIIFFGYICRWIAETRRMDQPRLFQTWNARQNQQNFCPK